VLISIYCYSLTDGKSVFYATVITLSCIVFILLVVNGVLIWLLRRAFPENRATTADKSFTDNVGQSVSPRDQHMSEPGSYMKLRPRHLEEQSTGSPEYKSLQRKDKNIEYYNVGLNEGDDGQGEIYQEIGNASCWVVSFHLAVLFIRTSRFPIFERPPRRRVDCGSFEHIACYSGQCFMISSTWRKSLSELLCRG